MGWILDVCSVFLRWLAGARSPRVGSLSVMNSKHRGLGIAALVTGLAAIPVAIWAAVLSDADSGESFGPQFILAERTWLVAGLLVVAALVLAVGSIVTRRGRRLGAVAVVLALLAAPVAVVVMFSLPAAQP